MSIKLLCLDVIDYCQNLIFGPMLPKVNYMRVTPEVMKNILLLAQNVCRVEGGVYAFESRQLVHVNINHQMGVYVQQPLVHGKQLTHIVYHDFMFYCGVKSQNETKNKPIKAHNIVKCKGGRRTVLLPEDVWAHLYKFWYHFLWSLLELFSI
jgi:hypothetical protein